MNLLELRVSGFCELNVSLPLAISPSLQILRLYLANDHTQGTQDFLKLALTTLPHLKEFGFHYIVKRSTAPAMFNTICATDLETLSIDIHDQINESLRQAVGCSRLQFVLVPSNENMTEQDIPLQNLDLEVNLF